MPKTLNVTGQFATVPGGAYTVKVSLLNSGGTVVVESQSPTVTVPPDPTPTPTAVTPTVAVV